jgi:hypothetical protein
MPELKEQQTRPRILPVDNTRDPSGFDEKIRGMQIPMPKCSTRKLPILQENIQYDLYKFW